MPAKPDKKHQRAYAQQTGGHVDAWQVGDQRDQPLNERKTAALDAQQAAKVADSNQDPRGG